MECVRRRGVASVVGTIFFVLVFMLALGALAYASGLQEQTSIIQEQAAQTASQRSSESLTYAVDGSALFVSNEGPATSVVNHLILRFPNGTVYPLAVSAAMASGATEPVESLVPAGPCSPGTSTCLSKYLQIVSGNSPGSAVGVVTSLGNTFWYAYRASQVDWGSLTGFPPRCPAGEAVADVNTTLTCGAGGGVASWVKIPATTSGTGKYSSTGLSATIPANGSYAFYVFTAIAPAIGVEKYNFEVHALATGSSLVIACAPMSYPGGGGNLPTNCVTSPGTPIAVANALGFGVAPPVYETPGLFGVVTMGPTGGALQIDFACTSGCGSVSIQAGSFMVVQPLG